MVSADRSTPPPRDSVDAVVDGWRAVRPDLDVSPVEVVTRLARVRGVLEQGMESVLGEHGLTAATFSALAAIARLEGEAGVTQVGLMRALQLTSGTVSVRVDRLVAEGLAERRPDPDDRRGTRIRLTARGRAAFEAAAPAHLDNERMLLAALSPEERACLAALLRRLLLDYEGCAAPEDDPGRALGLVLVPAHRTALMRRGVGLPERPGLLVRSVVRAGAAEAAGIREGDLLVRLGDRPVRALADVHAALAARPARALRALLLRAEAEVAVRIALP